MRKNVAYSGNQILTILLIFICFMLVSISSTAQINYLQQIGPPPTDAYGRVADGS